MSVEGQESFESEKDISIGSRDSNEPGEDDSDDSGSPPAVAGSYKEGQSPDKLLNGNITPPVLVSFDNYVFTVINT